jgi:hypothetical protein
VGTGIVVNPGAVTTDIDFVLEKAGFSGTIMEDPPPVGIIGNVAVFDVSGNYLLTTFTSTGWGGYQVGVPAGTYFATTRIRREYIDELYDDIPCPGGDSCNVTTGTAITVTPGATTTGIDFLLAEGGRISGAITDATTGAPLAGVEVTIYDSGGSFVSWDYTDPSGNYLTHGVPSGTHYAVTGNDQTYIDELYDDIPCPGYSCDVITGTAITVTQGVTTTGIDFALSLNTVFADGFESGDTSAWSNTVP